MSLDWFGDSAPWAWQAGAGPRKMEQEQPVVETKEFILGPVEYSETFLQEERQKHG